VSDTPARLGGDEFAILAEDLTGPEEAVAVGERIVRAFERPLSVMNQPVRLGVSVGVAASRGDVDAQTLLRSADMAMYRAKAFGKNRVEFFDPQMQQQSERRMRLEDELRTAIEKGTLSLAPQPVVDLETGTVESFEALLRWHHPALGEIPPDVLLPVAEQIGVMTRLGRWVLREAHRQGVVLSEFSGRRVTMAVNVAAEQLHDEQFLDHVARLADDPRVRLVLELTEGALVEEHMAVPTLTRLHDAGVGIAIDDFGVGYSSISYLHRFSCIDVVKIDRTFVREVATDPRTRALVESVVAMANAFDAVVVAEGIEDEESRTAFREAGCRLGQGFLFSPPVHLTRAAQFLEGTLPREPVAPVVPLLRRSRRKSG
jgi:predicted signal transduction protein with EAL and GGDEF domain